MSGEIHPFPPPAPPGNRGENKRRLAAVLAADVVGYSRLMGVDEEGTLARLKRIRRELIDPTIAEHGGRLIKNTGDGALVEFESPVEAVRCAIVVQQGMVARNARLPREDWIQFRIGINLGDIIIDDDGDIYGDGVNIAARLEAIAEPGGINISGGVYEQIKNKLVCGYQSLGDRKVKNITDPVPIYRVLADIAAVRQANRPRGMVAAAAVAVLCGIAAAGWYFWPAHAPRQAATTAAPAVSTSAAPAIPTPAPPAAEAAKPAIHEPEMVALQGGPAVIGNNEEASEKPVRRMTVAPFVLGKYPVTVAQWNDCAAAKACSFTASGDPEAPVTNVSWNDTQDYIRWLSHATNRTYRLPSEAEWEYAARGGTETKWWWGNQLKPGVANCKGCGEPYDPRQPAKVGSFQANPFGLYDMGGGVDQWVADCSHKDYHGAPADAAAWTDGDCSSHVLRGGSWKSDPGYLRPSSRDQYDTSVRYVTHGFRVARSY